MCELGDKIRACVQILRALSFGIKHRLHRDTFLSDLVHDALIRRVHTELHIGRTRITKHNVELGADRIIIHAIRIAYRVDRRSFGLCEVGLCLCGCCLRNVYQFRSITIENLIKVRLCGVICTLRLKYCGQLATILKLSDHAARTHPVAERMRETHDLS